MEPRERLIFALDVAEAAEAARYARLLDGAVGCFKVGLELFVSQGPEALRAVAENSAAPVFLDLKLHDIPATVRGALAAAARHRARYVTVHCEQGGWLPEGGLPGGMEALAVTVLTSLDESYLAAQGFRPGLTLQELAMTRARIAQRAGCGGVVCSGAEAAAVKSACGAGFTVVTPGIRPSWSSGGKDDQARTATPAQAIAAGADLIVVGRPIRAAADPRAAALRIVDEIASVNVIRK